MAEKIDWKEMVDSDIKRCEAIWSEYSHDKDILGELFHDLLARYAGVIDEFDEEMRVISPYEYSPRMAEVYRSNVRMMLERLKDFQGNGYSNEGLEEYRLKKETHEPISYEGDFTKTRLEIGMMTDISLSEKEDIMQKLGEMEEICSLTMSKRKKWDLLRGYVFWVSGRDVNVAMKILPLFFKIN